MALGLAAALRRSELVALQLADLELVREGLKLTIRHSKTDQEGEGQVIAVPSGKVLKPAKIATGFEIGVPIFVAQGDKVEIDTRTGEYRRRV